MAIGAGGLAVCCPTGVGDAGVGVEDLGQVWLRFGDELLELGYFADFFERKHLVLLVSIDG